MPSPQLKLGGLFTIPADICSAVVGDSLIWPHVEQFVWTVKPLVDVIRNLELQDTTLTDCMLEFMCCTCPMN